MKLLITSGPTREPIDSVRYITNLSSGETGRALANYFQDRNYDVVALYGKGSAKPEKVSRTQEFEAFNDLDLLLQKILKEENFDVVIHLAAVSDYSVKDIFKGKIESSDDDLYLTLKKNFKILDRIKSYGKKGGHEPFVVAFKLTDTDSKEKWSKVVNEIYRREQVDLVVHNDMSDFRNKTHRFRIFGRNGIVTDCQSVFDLGEKLENILRRT